RWARSWQISASRRHAYRRSSDRPRPRRPQLSRYRPSHRLRDMAVRFFHRANVLGQKAIDQLVGAGAVTEQMGHLIVTDRRSEIEALVLEVPASKARADEIPCEPEDARALLGTHIASAAQIMVDERPKTGIVEL